MIARGNSACSARRFVAPTALKSPAHAWRQTGRRARVSDRNLVGGFVHAQAAASGVSLSTNNVKKSPRRETLKLRFVSGQSLEADRYSLRMISADLEEKLRRENRYGSATDLSDDDYGPWTIILKHIDSYAEFSVSAANYKIESHFDDMLRAYKLADESEIEVVKEAIDSKIASFVTEKAEAIPSVSSYSDMFADLIPGRNVLSLLESVGTLGLEKSTKACCKYIRKSLGNGSPEKSVPYDTRKDFVSVGEHLAVLASVLSQKGATRAHHTLCREIFGLFYLERK